MDFKSNPNPMKKVNPEDLVVGQEYYVKMKLSDKDSTDLPYCFEDIQGSIEWLPQDQPIYTAEPDNDRLKMVVGVASRMLIADTHYSALEIESELGHNLSEDSQERSKQWASAYKRLVAREALELITACEKAIKEGSND